jgi:hypothetical protein
MPHARRKPHYEWLFSCEKLEARRCLSEVSFAAHVITDTANGAASVFAADLDGDADLDVLGAGGLAAGAEQNLSWYENTDGEGTFRQQHIIVEQVPATLSIFDDWVSVYAADLDGDGDMDVLSASEDDDKIAWYENLSPQVASEVAPGDANRDLRFDQLDIVQVLQAAKYLTGQPATFEEGDWNGDGVFDQLDIVAALQTGNHLKGPYAARAVEAVFAEGW